MRIKNIMLKLCFLVCWIVSIHSNRASVALDDHQQNKSHVAASNKPEWRVKYLARLGLLSSQDCEETKAPEDLRDESTRLRFQSQLDRVDEENKVSDSHEVYLRSLTFDTLMQFCDTLAMQMQKIDDWDLNVKGAFIELYKKIYRERLDKEAEDKEKSQNCLTPASIPIDNSSTSLNTENGSSASCAISLKNSLHEGKFGCLKSTSDDDPDYVFKKSVFDEAIITRGLKLNESKREEVDEERPDELENNPEDEEAIFPMDE